MRFRSFRFPGSSAGVRGAAAVTALLAAGTLLAGAGQAAAVRGGGPAKAADQPYTMLIELNGQQFCGGTLVAPTKVLTAGHCVQDAGKLSALRVIGGRTQVNGTDGTVRRVKSARMDAHYTSPGLAHDAAVLTLDRAMPYRPIPVAGPHDAALVASGRKALVLGWGRTGPGVSATRLKQTSLVLSPLTGCRPYTDEDTDPRAMLCGTPERGTAASVCPGDSGGPLVSGGKVVGIVSAGNKYCDGQYPVSVFVRTDSVAAGLGLKTA
ncbi:S1 family peptidase [Streptomyces sp. NPDC003703]|uniref:S1 family peptidase n=1 Tax=Streptomyces sp. NPDC003283 TaxID=3364681 RepID=UPI0036BA827E